MFRTDLNPCRICLSDEVRDFSNPIITPCRCSGSMGNIHLNCLRKWIEQKVSIRLRHYVTIIEWTSLSCELCKAPYPFAVSFDGTIYEVISIPYPKKPFVVLERAIQGSNSGAIYIIKFDKKQRIRIGRSSEVEWQLIDISISRVHAVLTYNNGELFLEDAGSKFGTLKQVNTSIHLQLGTNVAIQVDSTLCQFGVEKKPTFFSCFGSRAKSTKTFTIEKESEEDQDNFPSNGLHSLLMINKRKYQKLVKNKESKSLERKLLEEQKEKIQEDLNKEVVGDIKTKPVAFRGVYLRFMNNIRMLNGDTADDVIGE